MLKSERKVKALTHGNPNSLTAYEISGNDRKKAIELLEKLKEKEKQIQKQKNKKNDKI